MKTIITFRKLIRECIVRTNKMFDRKIINKRSKRDEKNNKKPNFNYIRCYWRRNFEYKEHH